ncbi:hypothetical protein AcW2_005265 [Taiwanofungus camphoratus]|nr:hypothetical protein AcW2_005265 [Antrodia cinnamomea]
MLLILPLDRTLNKELKNGVASAKVRPPPVQSESLHVSMLILANTPTRIRVMLYVNRGIYLNNYHSPRTFGDINEAVLDLFLD